MGAGISVIPLMIYKVLGLGKYKPISARLLIVYSSIKKPAGIVPNVEVKVSLFTYIADLMNLDCEVDAHSLIILGRLFVSLVE